MPPYGPNDPRLLQHQEPLIVWALIPIGLVVFIFLLLNVFRPGRRDEAESAEFWERVERDEGVDAGIVGDAIAPQPIELDPIAAIDALAQLGRLEREARARLDAERTASGEDESDDVGPTSSERYGRLFEGLAMQQDAIRANLDRYLRYRHTKVEALRDADPEQHRRELRALDSIEERYRIVDDGNVADI